MTGEPSRAVAPLGPATLHYAVETSTTGLDQTDEQLLRSARFRWALGLWVLNYLLGWPVVAIAAASTPWLGPRNAALLGSGSYALSWGVLGVAVLLGGSEIAVFGKSWVRRRLGRGTSADADISEPDPG